MRLAFLSNAPWDATGYGMQIKNVAPRLKALGHDVSIQAYHGHAGTPIDWNGIQIYGMVSHPYGADVMHAHAVNFKADCLISNMDAWVIDPALMFDTPWVAWFPVDSEPCPPLVLEKVKQAFHRIVWTEFAKREMDKADLDCDVIPYGVDTKAFFPSDKEKAREQTRMPKDAFIVGQVAMNKGYPPRKAFYKNIEAFKKLHDRHSDALLYLHTLDGSRSNGETIDLLHYTRSLGLEVGKDVIFADQYSYVLGYPEGAMNTLYNCMDVHMLVSMGEGFGMPQLEAQACGVPVICGDWTTMPELCFSGWKVDRSDAEPCFTLQNSYQFDPHAEAIAERLEAAYQMKGNADYMKRARDGAMKYDMDRIIERDWVPVLAKIDAKLKDAPDAGRVAQNMAMLRE